MLQIRNLEHEELDSVDDALRAIKEVKKIYKTTHFDRMEICDLVVEKKFKNSYIEKIDDILHGMVQNVNRKFNYPPNWIKNASEQVSSKYAEKNKKE